MQKDSRIVHAAIRVNDIIIPGIHHYDHFMIDIMHTLDVRQQWNFRKDRFENGFVDQRGNFYTTTEATLLAIQNKQIPESFVKTNSLSHALWGSDKLSIVTAAVFHDSYTFLSPHYFDSVFNSWVCKLPPHDYWRTLPEEQFTKGFVDSDGIFHDPRSALYIALDAKQIQAPKKYPITQLLVEDLY